MITAKRIVETTYDYVHRLKQILILYRPSLYNYEMEESKHFKMAAI